MEISTKDKIEEITKHLTKMDVYAKDFSFEIQKIVDEHKSNDGHIEYVYVEHFNNEIQQLSNLFQYLARDDTNKKYTFFVVRASIELILRLEYVFREKEKGGKEILSLLFKDLAQTSAALEEVVPIDDDHLISKTLGSMNKVSKMLNTDFDLTKITSKSHSFPNIKALCDSTKISIKNESIHHIYVLYSEANHFRLANINSVSKDKELNLCYSLEYFIEIYIKFYAEILKTELFPDKFSTDLDAIKESLGLRW